MPLSSFLFVALASMKSKAEYIIRVRKYSVKIVHKYSWMFFSTIYFNLYKRLQTLMLLLTRVSK